MQVTASGGVTLDFANVPNLDGKYLSWQVRIGRARLANLAFVQEVGWAGGVKPDFGNHSASWDLISFYKVENEPIRAMVIDIK